MTTRVPADEAAGSPAVQLGPGDISEILRIFGESGWSGMRLQVGEVTIAVGKDAAPPAPPTAAAPTVPPAPAVPAAVVPAAAGPSSDHPVAEPNRPQPSTDPGPIDETGLVAVTASTVGSFWVAPDPGSPPFVAVGSTVAKGDQLAIIEVMKLMSPVIADVAGEVVAVRANNAEMVEFGQTLFLIRPS
ncbi:acetyl-CoA carboxylase biotin carboxyl carrier protein [Gordonia polyisoprenivorans]|nr:biotin/lipoyl-containing protein [Gordonia polyisoprenivorans]